MSKRLSNNDLINELRALRTRLAPLMNQDAIALLVEVEQRITGDVSTAPAIPVNGKVEKAAARLTKSDRMQKYLFGRRS